MNNPRITARERGLLKGAVRRVFSRSDLRRMILDASRIEHSDPTRPRVKKWSRCATCPIPTPTYKAAVDHISPLIPVNTTLELMSWDDVINNTWCEKINLQVLCESCHDEKTKREREERKKHKEKNKNEQSSEGTKRTVKASNERDGKRRIRKTAK